MTFRTVTNLLDYNDNEKDFPESLTDETQYEPLETTIKRFERCGGIPQFLGDYDEGEPEEILDREDNPLEDENLDLADIAGLEEKASIAMSAMKENSPVKADIREANISSNAASAAQGETEPSIAE